MLASLATGAIGVAAVAAAWVAVQLAWGRMFARECSDPDVLAGRKGCCGGCDRPQGCDRGEER